MNSYRIDIVIGIRIEGQIECSISIESRYTIASHTSDSGECSSDEDLSICLNLYCSYLTSDNDRIEGKIKCSISIETSEIGTTNSSDGRECSSDEDLSICLDSRSIDDIIGIRISECSIEESSSTHTSYSSHSYSTNGRECSSDDYFIICSWSQSPDGVIDREPIGTIWGSYWIHISHICIRSSEYSSKESPYSNNTICSNTESIHSTTCIGVSGNIKDSGR